MIATILTGWTTQGDVSTPSLSIDHPLPPGGRCVDITGQFPPHDPNVYVVEVSGVSQEYLDAIESDARYNVISSDEEAEEPAI